MTDDHEHRRRRATYRAAHRGTKEMDWLLGRFASTRVAEMTGDELAEFEALLNQPDAEIEGWIMGSQPSPSLYLHVIAAVRRFHGL